jgi:single-stranded DNA-specific DHH superfamily exonuclease
MAAGVSIMPGEHMRFEHTFEKICQSQLTEDMLVRKIIHDGPLNGVSITLSDVRELSSAVWGQGFQEPMFRDTLKVIGRKRMGKQREHLCISVAMGDLHLDLLAFGQGEREPRLRNEIDVIYKMQISNYRGEKVQLIAEHFV